MARRGAVMFGDQLAGWIEETKTGMTFQYSPSWQQDAGAQPVSLALPIRSEPYTSEGPMPFFMGLLPEGWLFDIAVTKLKIAQSDSFGLILGLCADCTGAVSVRQESELDG